MTTRRTFLNACLLALGVRVPKAAVPASPLHKYPLFGVDPALGRDSVLVAVWKFLPTAGSSGNVLTIYDRAEICWSHPSP